MSPRNEQQNMQIKDERRAQILKGALKVFARNGFAATKIGDIAYAANVSHGLVYHYFSSKEEIFNELVSVAIESSSQALLQAEQLTLRPLEKVRAITETILQSIKGTEESAYYFLLMVQAMVGGKYNDTMYMQDQNPNTVMARIISEGQKQGQLKSGNAYDMAVVFFAAILGLATYKVTYKEFAMPSAEILIDMLRD